MTIVTKPRNKKKIKEENPKKQKISKRQKKKFPKVPERIKPRNSIKT